MSLAKCQFRQLREQESNLRFSGYDPDALPFGHPAINSRQQARLPLARMRRLP